MAWARVDDAWWSHPKVIGLSLEARGLWITALSWSCHQRKDRVPPQLLAMVGASDELAAELETAGLWINNDGWVIHNWAEYQDRTLSEKRSDAGRKGGLTSRNKQNEQANAKQNGLLEQANGQAGPSHPYPSLPNPPPHKVIHSAAVKVAAARGWKIERRGIEALKADGTYDRIQELNTRFPHAPPDHLAQMLDNGPLLHRYIGDEQ
jgi:hypothetical protein